ncbi:AMIN-like domain-containing (lipo)protein [Cellulomonas dongxiuzhuiae]|uniref:AMIN-like domain-containing protein n=1 Tax=Cellulomonas dongxiuzhuiae TaxID=2819979 RepID=A0ABX8GIZ4_9CELL|nr:hypothetical protein [Cellulomonas dongxiuzhuiae]MBO3094880.1 hypothetical protein [Cellulomonas dongxiuzhuiae]QWC15910.1 hypothetical protein KKR89_16910 [Cellulomonas dongxiuzhuiae]
MRNRSLRVLLALLLTAVTGLALAPAAAAHPYCGLTWGSLDRAAGDMSAGTLTDVRAGRHACYDRLVLDVDAPLTGWSVRYVDQVVQDGSGFVVPVQGGARLEVVARVGVVPTDSWFTPGGALVDTAGYTTFRDVRWAGSFEGVTTVGLGVRSRLPFRALVLAGPGAASRLVVDVAHRWCEPGHTC